VSWIAVLRDLRVFVWAHFQSKGGAIRNNDFCPRFPRINETTRLRAKFTTDDSDLSWTLGTSITNSFSFLHLIIIPLSLIIPPSLMGVICTSTWKEIFVSESLLRGWMGTSRLITYNLELTWTIHFEMICMRRRIIGLLQSQDLDGKPTFGFIVTEWSVNELFCLKAPRGGIVLVVVEDDRVLWRSTWFVEKEDWDFRLIELFLSLCLEVVTEDCRSRLYGNVLIKKYPPATSLRPE